MPWFELGGNEKPRISCARLFVASQFEPGHSVFSDALADHCDRFATTPVREWFARAENVMGARHLRNARPGSLMHVMCQSDPLLGQPAQRHGGTCTKISARWLTTAQQPATLMLCS